MGGHAGGGNPAWMNVTVFSSLRFRLIAIVLLAVIPALVLTTLTGLAYRRTVTASVETRALDVVRHVADDNTSFVETTQLILAGASAIPGLSEGRPPCSSALEAL
ncbi:MAG TPA: hypothetical protein VJO15_06110, partial [Dehalococcoidia bacterium]|nr:hypothetical protein [Dehalococcoidia bacterium]